MKRAFTILICFLFLWQIAFPAMAQSNGQSWYIKRGKNHEPPTSELSQLLGDSAFFWDSKASRDGAEKVIYLTFDVGYENGNVAKVLDILKEEEAQGAFFLLSHVIKKESELISRMENEGHLLCNHTARHKDMSGFDAKSFEEELRSLEEIYSSEREGRTLSPFYRPPEGKFSKENLDTAKKMGYKTIFWSLAYADWDDKIAPSDEKAKQILMDNTHNGAIVLLHPTSNINVRILKDMLIYWKNQGYRFGSLEEL